MTCNVTIKSTGVVALRITSVEVTGANGDDFRAGNECVVSRLTQTRTRAA